MKFDAKSEFEEAIKEIDLLLAYAKRNHKNRDKYSTFNKAAIVLLCSKFEAFLESFLEEYAYCHMRTASNKSLNNDLKEHLIDCLLESLEVTKRNKTKRRDHIRDLVKLCGEEEVTPVDSFEINPKFSYGKHGQKEVERLLRVFGFNSYLETEQIGAFFNKFNSLNNIRNNIIHQDKTPSLTHQVVEDYRDTMGSFINALHSHACELLE